MPALTRRDFLTLCATAGAAVVAPAGARATGSPDKTVTLRGGRRVSALGMGSWHLAQGEHSANQEKQALRTGIAHGMTVIDTAELYGNGSAERLIGRAIEGRRERIFLVSKILPSHASASGIQQACRASLKRLGVDHLDLYLLHWRGSADLDTVVAGFERLRADGLIRGWGVSNFDTADMQDLWRVENGHNCLANQVRYNAADRGIENRLLPWCRERDVAIMAYSPLGTGRLIGNETLAAIGRRHGVTGPAVALAWAIRSGQVIAIPESGTPAHIRADAKALTLTLDQTDIDEIDRAF